MSGWKEHRLEDLCERITVGFVGKMSNQYRDSGVAFLRSQNILPFRVQRDGILFIDEKFDERIKKSRLRSGDVAVVRTGYPGTATVIPPDLDGSNCADLVVITPSVEMNPHFLAAVFNSAWGRSHVQGQLVGSAQQHFNVGSARDMRVSLPDRSGQNRIADVLCCLNDLIENNRRRIEILEEMAQAIYREWFVHFRFPGHETATFVDSPLGPIPHGWTIEPIEEIASIKYGKMLPTKEILGGPIPVYGASKVIGYHTEANVMEPTILMGCRGTCGQVSISDAPAFVTNNSFTIVPRSQVDKTWLFHLLDTRGVEEFIGGAAQPQITLKSIGTLEVLAPPSHLREEFGSVVGSLLGCSKLLRTELNSLSQIRDALLPKLVSGEVDVSDLDLDSVLEGAADVSPSSLNEARMVVLADNVKEAIAR